VKEWLSYFLSKEHNVVRSPGSFNSQIGVALSMFEINEYHEIGVFEAGISQPNEMQHHLNIIAPKIGIFTNIGEAHSGGFKHQTEKIREKLKLFSTSDHLIVCSDHVNIIREVEALGLRDKLRTWGKEIPGNIFDVEKVIKLYQSSTIQIKFQGAIYQLNVKASDEGSIQNLLHCLACMLVMDYEINTAIDNCKSIFPIPMRLEMTNIDNNNTLINDAYNHDLTSLANALEFQDKQKGDKETIAILSDIEGSNMTEAELNLAINRLLGQYQIDEVLWLGSQGIGISDNVFDDKKTLEAYLKENSFSNSCILIKGARMYKLDGLRNLFLNQSHSSTLTIDLAAFNHNILKYATYLKTNTSLIAVIKAGAYGSGSIELARVLEQRGVKYLAVAFTDEAKELREAGIAMPIMILNSDKNSFWQLSKYRLEPEVYSLNQLSELVKFMNENKVKIPIHLKLDTGMHRLGMGGDDIDQLVKIINNNQVEVKSIFSHLAGSENAEEDNHTHQQAILFKSLSDKISTAIGQQSFRHLVNTSGIIRFPEYHFDMVRLGIGMYGIDTTKDIINNLEKVHSFTAKVIQTKWVEANAKIGYNQKGVATDKTRIAIVNVGYADGLPRKAGLGNFALYYDEKLCPIIGQVCMDLTIIDVTDCETCQEGSEVEIFGKNNSIEALAHVSETIPYEILSRISTRVVKKWVLD
jgi:alanine racemase